jgi:cell division protein FtsN
MASRDSQTVILSRQTILLVTAVGVGLLTLCYVLGVQVGKQSAALRRPAARGTGEDLQELPASIGSQLRALEGAAGSDAAFQPAAAPAPPAPAPAAAPGPNPPPAEARAPQTAAPESTDPKAETAPGRKKPEPAAEKPGTPAEDKNEPATRWTLQLISTPDPAEAQHMVQRARAAGFPAAVVVDKGLYKVRLANPAAREAMDATAVQLKNRGFKTFAIKIE